MKILSLLTLLFAAVTIFFEYNDRRFLWLFKPLAIILVIVLAWFYGEKRGFYRWAILAGLIFSLFGDVFLINPQIYFINGLASFFIAHLFYIFAFFKSAQRFNILSLFAFVIGFILYLSISNGVSAELRIPVILYTFAISTMLCFAFNYWLTSRNPKSVSAVYGAVLFVISDSIIAVNKFSQEFFLAKIFVLITYFSAQWLIARSVGITEIKFENKAE